MSSLSSIVATGHHPQALGSARFILSASEVFSASIHIPVPKPVHEPNRCNLEPFKPETIKTALYVVLAIGRLTLQVLCLGPAHFRLPVRPPKSPSRPTRENPRQAVRPGFNVSAAKGLAQWRRYCYYWARDEDRNAEGRR